MNELIRQARANGLKAFLEIDEKYNPGGPWWSRTLGVTERQIPRWRNGHFQPTTRTATKLIVLRRALETGKIALPQNWQCATHNAPPKGASGYKGVYFQVGLGLYQSVVGNKSTYWPTPEQAALVYNIEARKQFGPCAYQNDVGELPVETCHKCGIGSRLCRRILIWDKPVVSRNVHLEPSRCESVWCCLPCSPNAAWFKIDREWYAK